MPAQFESANSPIARDPVINGNTQYLQDDIVISGFSGRFPESDSIDELKKNLFEGVDMVTDDERRWPAGIYGLPKRTGKLKTVNQFDATFFGVHAKQAHLMDPQLRILLEATYEAIVDAGVNPQEIRGSKTGVFVGVSTSESNDMWTRVPEEINGYGLTGCCRAMFPNRVSFAFDFNGPSYAVDTACSSALYGMHQAISAMRSGECDAAIVAGCSLLLKPTSSLEFHRLGMLSPDGMCKAFDADGKGYVRSEAVSAIFLQKSKDARRVYATVIHSKTNTDGSKVEGITFPNGQMQNKLMREVYAEAGVNPADVAYVEAHGTGTKVGDPQEINSIANLFCKGRKTPLLLGSVKSNLGHAEPASGMCSMAKLLIAMETGVIPGNLHFQNPNKEIPALHDGSLQVVDKNTPWKGGLVAVNSFGFGGANAHVLLRSNPKPKLSPVLDSNKIPKLVTVSGRTEEAVQVLLDKAKEHEKDDEFIALVHDVHATSVSGHLYRGYSVLGTAGVEETSQINASEKRPVWFVFSGMGSQWAGMGKALLCIEPFKRSLQRCADALKPEGVDLMDVILHSTAESFNENIVYCFISIAAIQVALVDLLAYLGIQPDGIVGHSVGELGCAYADGTFTPEQTILAAYWRGRSILDSKLPPGAMAAVGLSWEEAKKRCPPDVYPACNNSSDSTTISGKPDALQKFAEELKKEDIFVRLVDSSGVAFHSKYMAAAGQNLRSALERIIPNPKPRTSRWISTSIPAAAWDNPLAQLSSAAYHVNNLLSPVLFKQGLAYVPENAITIEISPHCLMQAILRRSLSKNVTNISLHKRDHKDNLIYLLENLGKLYMAGAQPKISKLYPPISYPVGRGTPMINSMVKWDHSTEWAVADFCSGDSLSGENVIEFDLSKETDAYIAGHTIDGRVLFPATGYLVLVWRTYAKLRNVDFEKLPIVFENVKFLRATIMPKEGSIKFFINIFMGTNEFEICENGSVVVTGKVSVPENTQTIMLNLPTPVLRNDSELLELDTKDVYKELKLRGYEYTGEFQGIESASNRGGNGKLLWTNWISFMDTMLQITILQKDTRSMYLPTRMQYVAINPVLHMDLVNDLREDQTLPVYCYKNIDVVKSGGIEIRKMKASLASRRQRSQIPPKYEKYAFLPYVNPKPTTEDPEKAKANALTILLQIIRENLAALKMRAVEVAGDRPLDAVFANTVLDILYSEPSVTVDYQLAATSGIEQYASLSAQNVKVIQKDVNSTTVGQDLHFVVATNVLSKNAEAALNNLSNSLKPGGYILLEESGLINLNGLKSAQLLIVAKQVAHGKSYVLLKKLEQLPEPMIVQITEKNFQWVENLKAALKKAVTEQQQILVVNQGDELLGMVGLINCVRREEGGTNVRYVFIQDKSAPKFSLKEKFYTEQLSKQLMANVLKGGTWGSFRHLVLDQQKEASSLQVEHAYINALHRGDLSSLRWIESPLSYYQPEKSSSLELFHVYYAPLNFRDVMLATGKLPPDALPGNLATQDCILGLEFSGRDSKGERVMAMVPARGLATTVLADPGFSWVVPSKWSLEEASTIPVAYTTSYYALFVRGGLKPGESVLIHAGSGGVGQASISIALHAGCKVFTTVGTPEKRQFLKKMFPQLTDSNIGNSRDTSFEQLIMNETNGRGVDMVLNSLAEEKLHASLRCLAEGGRFLEIGKFDLSNDAPLGMSLFLKNTAFHGILLDAICEIDGPERREVVRLVKEGIDNGAVRPLPATVFSEQEIEQSFRFMATGKHIGKVVLKIREEEKEKVVPHPAPKVVPAIPRSYMNPDKSYILVGGLGGFGVELAEWMVNRGAKNLVLTSRSGIRNGFQSMCVRRWRESGVKVTISTVDATTMAGAKKLIQDSNKLAPVGGIFNLAAVLADNVLEYLEENDFAKVAAPKVTATKCLDAVSRELCSLLDYFVVFSSVSCGRGNIGQTNYGLANSAMERIVEQRQANGLPGLAIQWGAIGDVGLILDSVGGSNETEIGGTMPQRIGNCLETMDVFLQQPHPVLASMCVADQRKTQDTTNKVSIVQAIANILGIKKLENINYTITLADLGMDSLMGTEIKQTLERNYDVVLSAQDIRNLTFEKLKSFDVGSVEVAEVPEPEPEEEDEAQFLFQTDGAEIIPTDSLIQLKTKGTKGLPFFFVHAIEGLVGSLKGIASELNCPAWGFQCVQDAPLNTITELAKFYIQEMKKVQKKGPYHIVGYSFGACVAFEMALQLETAGEKVILTLLDGSPEFVRLHCIAIGKHASKSKADIVEDNCRKTLSFFIKQFNEKIRFIEAYTILKGTPDDQILDKMVETINNKDLKKEELKIAGMLFHKKLQAAYYYAPTIKFNGDIMLIRIQDNFIHLKKDYGLSEICQKEVQIRELPGNHRSILVGDNGKEIAKMLQT